MKPIAALLLGILILGSSCQKEQGPVLAVSVGACTLQQFAHYFQSRGCVTAMYLDGVVSAYATSAQTAMFVTNDYGTYIGVY